MREIRMLKRKDFLIAHKEVLFQCVLAIAIIIIATYRIDESTMPILLDDEYGYWSNSAFFTGDDWSSITSKIAYYSYGYSFLLVPIRLLAKHYDLTWAESYQLAQLVNVLFLVIGYFISIQLCKRYLKNLNSIVRSVACFAVAVYGSNLFYAHLTFTECVLNGVFWIFLYLMMKVIDKPNTVNHISYAVTAFYIYMVHQRAFAILITSVIVVIYLRLIKKNTLKHTVAFGIFLFLCSLFHSAIKGTLQHVSYRGNELGGWQDIVQYIFTKKSLLVFAAGVVIFVLLYLLEKGKGRFAFVIVTACVVGSMCYLMTRTGNMGAFQTKAIDKIAMNDFAGQWEKIAGLLTKSGMVRLGTSIVGKWFYLASATGLVICWGMRNLFANFFLMLADSAKRLWAALQKKEYAGTKSVSADNQNDRIWLTGVFLAWFGTFLICVIYKEGFFKNDDLFNGRYHEFVIGILLLYSLNILMKEKRWMITALISLILYLVSAWFCQFAMDEVKRTSFELAHSVMFGRVIWNYVVPNGRVRVLAGYVLGLSVAFFFIFKVGSRWIVSQRVTMVRCVLALLIPIFSWIHIANAIVDNYVVVRNVKQQGAMPVIALWADILCENEPIYFAEDYLSYRQAAVIQFMLQDKAVTMTHIDDIMFDEDACYIINNRYITEDPRVLERCKIVVTAGDYALVIQKAQNLDNRWEQLEKHFQ